MNNLTKQDIIKIIQKIAKENGGKPLGIARFEKESNITQYEWKKYWARFGDALTEAGFEPNQMQGAYSDKFIIEKIISIMRKLNKFPTRDELNVAKHHDAEFPSRNVFFRFGTKQELVEKIYEYCRDKTEYKDIILLCKPLLEGSSTSKNAIKDISDVREIGEVYLFKSGRYYKIGKTNDAVRRGNEIRVQLPEKTEMIHSIKTDDPSGIEAYWHKRFDLKRMNGEWFDLNSNDIKTFKRWRRIY